MSNMLICCIQGKVRYALRPVLPSGCQAASSFCASIGAADAVTLSGYGVELALKNMEYKAMDDTAIKKGNSSCSRCFICTGAYTHLHLALNKQEI